MRLNTELQRFGLCWLAVVALVPVAVAADDRSGRGLYERRCATCHGMHGEGSREHYPQALEGERSTDELARFIATSMPPDEPGAYEGEDARAVAAYIHQAFYSPQARATRERPRIDLARLTARQHANVIADLMVAFYGSSAGEKQFGLRGNYATINANGDGKQVFSRIDPEVRFDFGVSSPSPEQIDPAEFAISWTGSVAVPATGDYEFIVRSPNSVRLYVNDRKTPLVDAWVKSGEQTEYRGMVRLLGGRDYLLQLHFTKAGQGGKKPENLRSQIAPAAISLAWKPPGQSEETIPACRLSPQEVRETLLLQTSFPPDDRSTGFERGTAVSPEWEQATTAAAVEAATYVRERLGDFCGVIEPNREHESTLRDFCARFTERAFRRPLTPELRAMYVDRQFERAPDAGIAVERAILMTLKSPRFLYVNAAATRADAYDVAAALSFALWDSLPDDALLAAAAAGQLATREQVAGQAERMMSDPRVTAKLREFVLAWLKIDRHHELRKEPTLFPNFNPAIEADLRTSLELFLEEVLSGERADFRTLLLADAVYLNGRLAPLYGADMPRDEPFRKVVLDSGERAGVLTHPYLMATLASESTSSPIRRGVLLARGVLARVLRPPPDAVTPIPAALHPDLTTRERTALQTADHACQSCHALINPLGYPLERFDAIGRFRTTENGRVIDAAGSYLSRSGKVVTFDGARQLSEFLAGSDEVHDAIVEKLFYYVVKQPVRAFGSDVLPALRHKFVASEFNMRRLMVEIAALAAFERPAQSPFPVGQKGKE
ncbi:MAG TPA: DUF1592 domain-containing protein [Pirellulales bacterium]|nr:DUF1592 domain-containing protein [Pirellulales bacterium]